MTSKRPALGRGLDALLGTDGQLRSAEDARALVGGIFELSVRSIQPNPFQPRKEFNPDALQALADSIEQLGIIQPITVRATKGDEFELISGERRLRAAKLVGLQEIPAYIRPAKNARMLEMALVENVQREELNPIEVALGYQRLVDEYGLTQDEVARRVGKKRSTITNFIRLLHLPPKIQVGLREGVVTPGHARALLSLPDEQSRNRIFKETQREQLSVREVEKRVNLLSKQNKKPKISHVKPDAHLTQIENRLRKILGTKVCIKRGARGQGLMEIHYYSDDDLTRIIGLFDHPG